MAPNVMVAGRSHGPRPDGRGGFSLIELLVALAVCGVVLALTVPTIANVVDASRAGQAAGSMASRFRQVRFEAVARGRHVGVVFDPGPSGWTFRVCIDGNGNGVRHLDIAAAVDPCPDGPYDLSALFPGVQIDVDPTLPGPAGEPPSPNAVRFGSAAIASFSPLGSATAGSVYLRSPQGAQYAVRVAGATGRTRILRYDPAANAWIEV